MDDKPSNDQSPYDVQSQRPGWRQAPLIKVLLAQALGALIAFSAALLAARFTGLMVPLLAVLFGQGLFAAWIGHKLALPKWWIPVQVVLPPGAAYATAFAVPGWVYLIIFILLLLVYWNALSGRVPLYLTNNITWQVLLSLFPEDHRTVFIDVGCGIGGTLFYLARHRPNDRIVGIESAPVPFAIAWIRRLLGRHQNVDLIFGSFWKHDFSAYDIVYAFLSPAPMPALWDKLRHELREDAMLISNSFTVPSVPGDEIVTVDDRRRTKLHIWKEALKG